jgi:hypothetical protein
MNHEYEINEENKKGDVSEEVEKNIKIDKDGQYLIDFDD